MIKHYQTNLIQSERLILKKGIVSDYLTVYEYDFTKLRDIDGEFEYVGSTEKVGNRAAKMANETKFEKEQKEA